MSEAIEKTAAVEPELSGLDRELLELEAEAEGAPSPAQIEAMERRQVEEVSRAESVKAEYYGLILTILTPLPAVFCPNWNLQQKELEALANAYAEACAQQWPDGVGEMGPWMGAALTTAVIIGPRLGTPPRVVEKKREPEPVLAKDDDFPEQEHGAQQGGGNGGA